MTDNHQAIFEKERIKYEKARQIWPGYGASDARKQWINKKTTPVIKKLHDCLSKSESVLDIGCASGQVLSTIVSHYPYLKCTGIDISETAIKRKNDESMLKKYPHLNVLQLLQMHAEKLSFDDNLFDVVYHFDGLEHIDPRLEQTCIKEAVRVSKKYICYSISTAMSGEDATMIKNGFEPLHINIKNHKQWNAIFNSLANMYKFRIMLAESQSDKFNILLEKLN